MARVGSRSKIRGVLGLLIVCVVPGVSAQTWTVQGDGRALADVTASSADAPGEALRAMRDRGYHYARVDSIRAPIVFVSTGPLVVFGAVGVISDSLPVSRYREVLTVREGEVAVASSLSEAVGQFEQVARREGFVSPSVTVTLGSPVADSLHVVVRIREGERLPLRRVLLDGAERATAAFAFRATGLAPGAPLVGFDADRVRQSLVDTGAFDAVGTPELVLDLDGDLAVVVPVEEGPPGTIDAVLGYLPPTAGRSGEVVGTARVDLASPFGEGRTMALALDRSPGLASRFSVFAADPFVFGSPVRVGLGFEGESRDSTYSRQLAEAEAGLRLAPGLSLAVRGSRESVQPGREGARVGSAGVPRVRRSSGWFGGLVVRYASLDSRTAPTRGVSLVTSAEQGVRTRDALDDVAAPTRLRQQRFDGSVRVFVPVRGRVGAVVGGDTRVLITERGEASEATRYDEGELFRFGGASSLRGYDEDTFLGHVVGRGLAEIRVGLGGDAFGFGFTDLGFVRRPDLADSPAETRWLPSYGVGAQLETGLGLVALTYALNPDLPASRGKVHLRLRLGL